MQARPGQRIPALLALAIPVAAGVVYLAIEGAPDSLVVVHCATLLLVAGWTILGRAPGTIRGRRMLAVLLIGGLFLPPLIGPQIGQIARWLPLGPFSLNAGTLLFPAIAVLAAQDDDYAPPMLLSALLAAMFQPDAALGFAIVFAAVALHDATKDWRLGMVVAIGFFASLFMTFHGELPPSPYVERVLPGLIQSTPALALLLVAAMGISFFLMLFAVPLDRRSRYALAGSLFGFTMMGVLSHYPSILIGYGAAPILGYGMVLGLCGRDDDISNIDA